VTGVRVDHLGLVVADMDEALRFFTQTLKATVLSDEREVGGGPLHIAFVETGGTMYELIHPSGSGSKFYHYLQEHGPGIHHIAFAVDSMDQATAQLLEVGVGLEGSSMPKDGRTLQALNPQATLGIVMQLIQRHK